ncbi:unnamed protein product [Rotaria sordida]|uniref:Uncharacterized protein n=1 Tax=Rotaria sordida TaxID=392033 RepID=A0A815CC21_9BILA|nr:unnamed protein product [Rotaria sordida]CAF1377327.1 unnamed protein product [Rotaria sordida]
MMNIDLADALEIASEKKRKKLKYNVQWNRQHRRYDESMNEAINNNNTAVSDSGCLVFPPSINTNDALPVTVSKPTAPTDNDTADEDELFYNDEDINTPLDLNDFSENDEYSTSSQLENIKQRLHPFTDVSLEAFSHEFLHLLRKSNVSKTHAQNYLTLIKNILPEPNSIPKNMIQLYRQLGINENLFTKRIVCQNCLLNISSTNIACPRCGIIIIMSNTSNVASRVIARRQQLRQQETAHQSTGYGNSTAISSSQYHLLFFGDNEERLILPENNIKKFIDDKAIVMIDRKRKIATIEAQGSLSLCQAIRQSKLDELEQIPNIINRDIDNFDVDNGGASDNEQQFDENDEEVNDTYIHSQVLKQQPTTVQRTLNDINDPSTDISVSKRRRTHLKSQLHDKNRPIKRLRPLVHDDDSENEETRSGGTAETTNTGQQLQVNPQAIYSQIDGLFNAMTNTIERRFTHFDKKIERLTQNNFYDHSLDLFREKDETFESTVMYQNEDLLRIRAKDYGDYGRLLLRKLYSKQELAECILPTGHQRYRRPPLDNDRFEYLHSNSFL